MCPSCSSTVPPLALRGTAGSPIATNEVALPVHSIAVRAFCVGSVHVAVVTPRPLQSGVPLPVVSEEMEGTEPTASRDAPTGVLISLHCITATRSGHRSAKNESSHFASVWLRALQSDTLPLFALLSVTSVASLVLAGPHVAVARFVVPEDQHSQFDGAARSSGARRVVLAAPHAAVTAPLTADFQHTQFSDGAARSKFT